MAIGSLNAAVSVTGGGATPEGCLAVWDCEQISEIGVLNSQTDMLIRATAELRATVQKLSRPSFCLGIYDERILVPLFPMMSNGRIVLEEAKVRFRTPKGCLGIMYERRMDEDLQVLRETDCAY